jgi:hypothetical protein
MKHLTLRRNRSNEALIRFMMLKNWSDEAFNASSPHFIASSLSTLYISTQKSPKNRAKLSNPYVKAKTKMFFGFATKTTKNNEFLGKLPLGIIASLLLFVNIIFRWSIKAMMANSGSDEAMKPLLRQKIKAMKQWSV